MDGLLGRDVHGSMIHPLMKSRTLTVPAKVRGYMTMVMAYLVSKIGTSDCDPNSPLPMAARADTLWKPHASMKHTKV